MKKKSIMAILVSAAMVLSLAGCGGSGTSSDSTAAKSGSGTGSGGSEAEQQADYPMNEEVGNEEVEAYLIGADVVELDGENYMRVFYKETNLTDEVLSVAPFFSVKQDDETIYATPSHRGHDTFKTFASAEGFAEEDYLNAWNYFAMTGNIRLMPGVTKYSIEDFKLVSDAEISMHVTVGTQTSEFTMDPKNMPGAPDIAALPKQEAVSDLSGWESAVTTIADSGTITVSKRYGDVDFVINEVTLEDDPNGLGYDGKLIKVNASVTNPTDEEITAEVMIENTSILDVYQDGCRLNLALGSMTTSGRRTKIAAGETGAIDTYFLPISDSPVMVVIGDVRSAGSRKAAVNFGNIYSPK